MIKTQTTKKLVERDPDEPSAKGLANARSGQADPLLYVGWAPLDTFCVMYRCECWAMTQIILQGHEIMRSHDFACSGCAKRKVIGVDVQNAP